MEMDVGLTVMHLCGMNAKIHTDHGTMTVEFFEKDAPNTVANFVKLAKEGFYEGLKFHRVILGLWPRVDVRKASAAEDLATPSTASSTETTSSTTKVC